jgi:hypothetical protein
VPSVVWRKLFLFLAYILFHLSGRRNREKNIDMGIGSFLKKKTAVEAVVSSKAPAASDTALKKNIAADATQLIGKAEEACNFTTEMRGA